MDKTSLEKAAFLNQNNGTFAVDYNLQMHQENLDDFRGIFAFKVFNWLMFAIYLLGYLCCFALALVIWFEYSGRAGPFRTLVNQLFSEILIQVSLKQKLNDYTIFTFDIDYYLLHFWIYDTKHQSHSRPHAKTFLQICIFY